RVAWLALVFFTVDESHTVPLSWIANRCALSSVLLCTLGIIAYVQGRERGKPALSVLSFACYALAFGFGEYALCGAPFPIVYELFRYLDARRDGGAERSLFDALRERVGELWPVAVPSTLYLVLRSLLGCVPLHSGIYVSPERDPIGFARNVLERFPVLYAD